MILTKKNPKDLVGAVCREINCAAREFFRAAYRWWRKGRIDTREVSHAYWAYRRKGKAKHWAREFARHLRQIGATSLPTPAQ